MSVAATHSGNFDSLVLDGWQEDLVTWDMTFASRRTSLDLKVPDCNSRFRRLLEDDGATDLAEVFPINDTSASDIKLSLSSEFFGGNFLSTTRLPAALSCPCLVTSLVETTAKAH